MALVSASCPIHSLYLDHQGWLNGWLRGKMGCSNAAADLTQDTFVRVLASQLGEHEMRAPRAFLATIARRLLIDRVRRQTIEQAYLAELVALVDPLGGFPSPDEILAAVQLMALIADALDGVPPKAGEAFLLHYLDGLPHREVAEQLGVGPRMVRKYLAQCLLACARAAQP